MKPPEKHSAAKAVRRTDYFLISLLALALFLRLLFLGRAGLWQDEMGFMLLVRPDLTLGELARVARDYILSVGQMPLTILLQNLYVRALEGWIPGIARDAFWLRLPAVLFGVAAVAGVYRLVEAAADRTRAVAAGLLFSVMFFPVYYAREVYCYAAVIAGAAWMTADALRHVAEGAPRWRYAVSSAVWALILVYSHLNGALYFGCVAAVTGVLWLLALRGGAAQKEKAGRLAGLLGLWTLVLLAVMPYLLRFLFENKAHTGGHVGASLSLILQDPVAKMFFGETPAGLVVSWLLFGLGVVAAWQQGARTRWPLVAALLAWLVVGVMTARSQYLSVRYFAPLAPVFCWLLVEALAWLARRFTSRLPILPILAGVVAAVHIGWFLVPMYGLKDKDLGFARIAEWLNTHLTPGTPYLMESAYELRWVSNYHPTPGLIGAAPYVHRAGPGEVERLHQRQQAFMERFPEAPFIQSAHHNVDNPEGIWKWPHAFHARMDRLANEPLRALVRRGIFIGLPMEKIARHSYSAEIYYSTTEDLDARAKARGQVARVDYPGWTVGQIAQGEYRRVLQGAAGQLAVRRLAAEPVRVRVSLRLALDATPSMPYELVVSTESGERGRVKVVGGQWVNVDLPDLELRDAMTAVSLQWIGHPPPRATFVDSVRVERL